MSHNIFVKRILIVLGIIVLTYFAYIFLFTAPSYKDSANGFIINNPKGWVKTEAQSGTKLTLATKGPDNKAISTFTVGVLKHLEKYNKQEDKNAIEIGCKDLSDKTTQEFKGIEEVNINGISGIVCKWEGTVLNTSGTYVVKMYTLHNGAGKQYDYIIGVSYPKNNKEELKKVENIVNSFKSL